MCVCVYAKCQCVYVPVCSCINWVTSAKLCMRACVCACVLACVRACMRACVCVCVPGE